MVYDHLRFGGLGAADVFPFGSRPPPESRITMRIGNRASHYDGFPMLLVSQGSNHVRVRWSFGHEPSGKLNDTKPAGPVVLQPCILRVRDVAHHQLNVSLHRAHQDGDTGNSTWI